MRKFSLLLSIIFIIAVVSFFYFKAHQKKFLSLDNEQVMTKMKAPDFDFQDINGNRYKLSDFKGKLIILNFRIIDCRACDYEVELLNSFYNKLSDNNIQLISIFEYESLDSVIKYVESNNVNFPTYLDSYGISGLKYRIIAYPTTVIIDKNFNLIKRLIGVQNWQSQELISYLNKIGNE